jgi:hypothetical protein
MELTEIVKQSFMGVPYEVISADSYPIPEGWPRNNNERQLAAGC